MELNTNALLWTAGAMLMLITFAQWILLRSRYLDGLTKQRTRHALQLQTAGQHIDQARRQIAQLQLDLTGARSQLARIAARRETGAPARRGEPFDGFADTLPAPQYPHDGALLATYPKHH